MENSAANLGVERGWRSATSSDGESACDHSLELGLVELGSIAHPRFQREAGLEAENRVLYG